MDPIDEVLAANGNVATRAQSVAAIGRVRLDSYVRSGQLVRLFPRVYARPWDADLPATRARAAVVSVGGDAALSHVSALAAFGLPAPPDRTVHVTAYQPRHPRGIPGELVVHRTKLPMRRRLLSDVPIVSPELAVVTSWPMLSGDVQRAPLILANQRRLLHPDTLSDLAQSMFWVRGRRQLLELCALVLSGCESELELWGHQHVFDVEGLRDATRQRVVRVGSRVIRFDRAYEEEKVAIELDGRMFHADPGQWERDIARDVLAATAGWQTIRFSHSRLRTETDECRRCALAVLALRRRHAS